MKRRSGLSTCGRFDRRLVGPRPHGFLKRVTGGDGSAFFVRAIVGLVGCLAWVGLRRSARFKGGAGTTVGSPTIETP